MISFNKHVWLTARDQTQQFIVYLRPPSRVIVVMPSPRCQGDLHTERARDADPTLRQHFAMDRAHGNANVATKWPNMRPMSLCTHPAAISGQSYLRITRTHQPRVMTWNYMSGNYAIVCICAITHTHSDDFICTRKLRLSQKNSSTRGLYMNMFGGRVSDVLVNLMSIVLSGRRQTT